MKKETSIDSKVRILHIAEKIFADKGFDGAMGQAIALVIAKKGLRDDFPALSANLIRIITSTVIFWIIASFRGNLNSHLNIWLNKKKIKYMDLKAE